MSRVDRSPRAPVRCWPATARCTSPCWRSCVTSETENGRPDTRQRHSRRSRWFFLIFSSIFLASLLLCVTARSYAMRRLLVPSALTLAFALLVPVAGYAQQSVNFSIGGFVPKGEDSRTHGDVLVNNLDFLAFDLGDF